ncbi:MAG: 5'/3'-nucleotidase SurE, partial [Chrysiogenales bacterium]
MKILLTNDDGIGAAGINAAYEILSSDHEVYLMAPVEEKSACSNAITVRGELNIKQVAEKKFTVNGYPADCVIIGLSGSVIPEVDLIVSGINHGPNVGDDLVFSGTVAGARTAYVFGKPSVAISINSREHAPIHLKDAAIFLREYVNDLIEMVPEFFEPEPTGAGGLHDAIPFFNINYPDISQNRIRGVKYTHIGKRIYRDSFEKVSFVSGEATLQMGGY